MTKKKQQAIVPHQGEEIKLTPKQRKFLWHYFRSGNGVQSALKAYDTKDPATAGVIASQNLAKLKDPIRTYMESNGLSLGRLVGVVNKGLEAKKQAKDGSKVEDYAVRHKYLETAAKWLGVEGKNGPGVEISKSQFNFFSISKEERTSFNELFAKFIRSQQGKKAFISENTEVVEAEVIKESKV